MMLRMIFDNTTCQPTYQRLSKRSQGLLNLGVDAIDRCVCDGAIHMKNGGEGGLRYANATIVVPQAPTAFRVQW